MLGPAWPRSSRRIFKGSEPPTRAHVLSRYRPHGPIRSVAKWLINDVDDVAVGCQALADDYQRSDARLQAQLFLEFAAQGGVERLVALEPATREHPVALVPLAMFDQQDLVLADDERRHAQLWGNRVKGLHQGRQTDQRCAHRSGGLSATRAEAAATARA